MLSTDSTYFPLKFPGRKTSNIHMEMPKKCRIAKTILSNKSSARGVIDLGSKLFFGGTEIKGE